MPDSAKRMVLDELIARDLMLEEATQRGLASQVDVNRIRNNAEEQTLLGALIGQVAPNDVPVSAGEIEQYYDWHKTEHRMQVIYAPSQAMAEQVQGRLAAGQSFDAVARQFNVGGIAPPDGNLGWVPGGALPGPLDTRTREARIGQVIGPVNVGTESWFFVRVLERRQAPQLPPLAAVREPLEQQVRERKHRATIQHVVTSLGAEYDLSVEPGGPQALFARASLPIGDTTATELAAQQRIVLARWNGPHGPETYKLADALAEMQGGADRPNFSSVAAIASWIQSQAVRRLVLIEARRRHLQEEPDNARRIKDQVEGALLQAMYSSEVGSHAAVSEEEMRAEFQRRVGGANPMPYESMPPDVREQLRGLALETKRGHLLKQLTDALRSKYPVQVNEPLLRRLEWPGPAFGPGAPAG